MDVVRQVQIDSSVTPELLRLNKEPGRWQNARSGSDQCSIPNAQFPMLNSYPNRGRPHEYERFMSTSKSGEIKELMAIANRLRIVHWELSIGQILGPMRSSGYCQVIFARALKLGWNQ